MNDADIAAGTTPGVIVRTHAGRARFLLHGIVMSILVMFIAMHHPPTDFKVFIRAATAVSKGISPYPPLNSVLVYGGSAFVYPLPAAYSFVPLAMLPFAVARFLFILGSCTLIVVSIRLLGAKSLATMYFVIASAVAIRSLQLGTVNGLLLFLVAACWYWREYAMRAGMALAAMILIKLFLVPIGLWAACNAALRGAALDRCDLRAIAGGIKHADSLQRQRLSATSVAPQLARRGSFAINDLAVSLRRCELVDCPHACCVAGDAGRHSRLRRHAPPPRRTHDADRVLDGSDDRFSHYLALIRRAADRRHGFWPAHGCASLPGSVLPHT